MTSSCQLAPSFFHSPKKVFLGLGIIFLFVFFVSKNAFQGKNLSSRHSDEFVFFFFSLFFFSQSKKAQSTSLGIVQTVQKTSKTCIIQFGPEAVLFLLPPDIQDGIQIWSNVKVVGLFTFFLFFAKKLCNHSCLSSISKPDRKQFSPSRSIELKV